MRVLLVDIGEDSAAHVVRVLEGYYATVDRAVFVPNSLRLDCQALLLSLDLPGDFVRNAVKAVEVAGGRPVLGLVQNADDPRIDAVLTVGVKACIPLHDVPGQALYNRVCDAVGLKAAVPSRVERIMTPPPSSVAPSPPEVGDPPHLDIEATLREIHKALRARERSPTGKLSAVADGTEDDVLPPGPSKFVQRWGWLFGVLGVVFSAGIGYTLFLGSNATDKEVNDAVKGSLIQHNGGVDPNKSDAKGRPYGHHPDLRSTIENNMRLLQENSAKLDTAVHTQAKFDTRSRYQHEFVKWQVQLIECERTNSCTREDKKKPKKLDDLESQLIHD